MREKSTAVKYAPAQNPSSLLGAYLKSVITYLKWSHESHVFRNPQTDIPAKQIYESHTLWHSSKAIPSKQSQHWTLTFSL